MAEEKKSVRLKEDIHGSGTTAHLERKMARTVDHAESTKHIEQRMVTITTPVTTPVVANSNASHVVAKNNTSQSSKGSGK